MHASNAQKKGGCKTLASLCPAKRTYTYESDTVMGGCLSFDAIRTNCFLRSFLLKARQQEILPSIESRSDSIHETEREMRC